MVLQSKLNGVCLDGGEVRVYFIFKLRTLWNVL